MALWRCVIALLLAAAGFCAIAKVDAAPRQTAAVNRPPAGEPAPPTPDMRIAAVVNDEVISVFDLVSRMRLVELSSNLPDTPETRQRIGGQVLRALVDEKLQLQEAKRQNVVATDDE